MKLEFKTQDFYIKSAKALLDKGNLESAGVFIGKALERMLKRLCDKHKLPVSESKHHNIAECNTMLRDGKFISEILSSRIDVCRNIRNICSHDNQAEKITESDIKFGIETAERVIRQFFPEEYEDEDYQLGVEYCDKAMACYQKSAEAGYDEAQYALGCLYLSGNSEELALFWIEKAYQQNHPLALFLRDYLVDLVKDLHSHE